MPAILGSISLFSHILAVVAFTLLGAGLVFRRHPTTIRLVVALASFITAFWAVGYVLAAHYGFDTISWLSRMETLRSAAWIGVLIILQQRTLGLNRNPTHIFVIAVGLGFTVAMLLVLELMFPSIAPTGPVNEQPPYALLFVACRLILAISGLVLLHNLYTNSGDGGGISFRLFAVGLGVMCAYDLNLYTLHFLLGEPNQSLLAIRGAVNMMAAPLIYLALRQDKTGRLHLSRQAAFQTVSFSIIGLYLILMSLLAYGLKVTGGNWGQLLQITFLCVSLMAGILVALSPRARAELKLRISRNFYRYRYDYRVEWLRFIDKMDAIPQNDERGKEVPFRERLIEAVAAVVDCPGGILLEPSPAGGYRTTTRWRWPELPSPEMAEDCSLLQYISDGGRVADFDQLRAEQAAGQSRHIMVTLPAWAQDTSAWLGVPLMHRERLNGILLLQRSLAKRELNWEDHELLRTLGRQSASYLAESETQAALEEAKRFEEFNRRFAFVMHDVKNLVSQLGLVARNAERHADKPEFRADMVTTLNSSVAKMTDLLKLMSRETEQTNERARPEDSVDIARTLTMVGAAIRRQHAALEIEGAEGSIMIPGDQGRVEAMLTHLVQNAVDASAPDAPVRLRLDLRPHDVRITVADSGHGMSPAFVRDELFKPFRSTKDGGFGIGAFEARDIARAHGGSLEVESHPGEGTRFTILLPRYSRSKIRQPSYPTKKVSR